MFSSLLAVVGSGGGRYQANAVDFNGSTDYLSRTSVFSGAATSSTLILSAWFRLDGGDGSQMDLIDIGTSGSSYAVRVTRLPSNKISVLSTYGGSSKRSIDSSGTYTASSSWHHILVAWDASSIYLYINGISVGSSPNNNGSSVFWDVMDKSTIARYHDSSVSFFNGCLSEVYIAPGQYLDLTVQANREKFRSAAGKPVDLGATGSLPTGTAPLVYLKNPAASVGTNSGTGGNFTTNGSPTVASSSPSD